MDVADLLELERAFEGRRETVAATEVQEVLRVLELFSDLLDLGCAIEDVLDLGRQRLHLFDNRLAIDHRQVAQPRQLQREQKQRDDLAGESFRRSHPDLGTGVDVNAPVTLARDSRPDDVHDAVRARTTRFRFAHRGERIRRFT